MTNNLNFEPRFLKAALKPIFKALFERLSFERILGVLRSNLFLDDYLKELKETIVSMLKEMDVNPKEAKPVILELIQEGFEEIKQATEKLQMKVENIF